MKGLYSCVKKKLEGMSKEQPYAKVLLFLKEHEFHQKAKQVYEDAAKLVGADHNFEQVIEDQQYMAEHKNRLCETAVVAYEKQFREDLLYAARAADKHVTDEDIKTAVQTEYPDLQPKIQKREQKLRKLEMAQGFAADRDFEETFKAKFVELGCVILHLDDTSGEFISPLECLELVRAHQTQFPWLAAIAVRDAASDAMRGIHVLQNMLDDAPSRTVRLLLPEPMSLDYMVKLGDLRIRKSDMDSKARLCKGKYRKRRATPVDCAIQRICTTRDLERTLSTLREHTQHPHVVKHYDSIIYPEEEGANDHHTTYVAVEWCDVNLATGMKEIAYWTER
jgi:hypothetical protein